MCNLICFSALMVLGLITLAPLSSSSAIKAKPPPSRLMFDYNWPEPDSKIRKYPHERYCHYFYSLEFEDTYTIRKCPKGEIFDYHSHECKDKESAQCWSHRYGKTEVHDSIHSKLERYFKCPFSSGRYPDVFHCEKYFVCVNGVSKHKHCAPTYLFDRIRRHCVAESVALCADESDADDINHRCPKPSGKFGHPKDCSKYYQCHHGKRELQTCENSKLFDEMNRQCKDKEQVQCGYRYSPYDHEKVAKEVVAATKGSKLSLDTTTEHKEILETNSAKIAEKTRTTSVSSSKASKIEASISPSEQVRTTNIATNEQTESLTSPKEKISAASTNHVTESEVKQTLSPLPVSSNGITALKTAQTPPK